MLRVVAEDRVAGLAGGAGARQLGGQVAGAALEPDLVDLPPQRVNAETEYARAKTSSPSASQASPSKTCWLTS